jgi:hypothetical protein
MRTNTHLAIRHDAYRFMPPGSPRYVGKDVVNYFWPEQESAPSVQTEDVDQRRDLAAELTALLRLRSELAALKFLRVLRTLKAYDPKQPRDDHGRWANGGGGNVRKPIARVRPLGFGHNAGPPLENPPEIPKKQPPTARLRNSIIKSAAR